MKKTSRLLLFCLLLLAVSCRSVENKMLDGEIITIPSEYSDLFEFVEKYDCITLDTTNIESLFSYLTNLRVVDGKIFILDQITQKFLVFNTDGQFLKKIGHRGRGPSEYVNADKIEIDHYRREVVLTDKNGGKLLFYDYNGNFLRSESLSLQRFGNIVPLMDDNMASAYSPIGYYQFGDETGDYKLWICDRGGNVLNRFFQDDLRMNYGIETPDNIITHTDGSVTFSPQFSNQIFEVSSDGLTPKYGIEFSFPALKHDDINSLPTDPDFSKSERDGKTFFAGNHAESSDYLYLQLGFLKVEHVFYEKHSSRVIRTNDRLCGQYITTDENGYFWAYINPNYLLDDSRENAKKVVESSNKLENFVLARYKVKNF